MLRVAEFILHMLRGIEADQKMTLQQRIDFLLFDFVELDAIGEILEQSDARGGGFTPAEKIILVAIVRCRMEEAGINDLG